jgi:hypothetical protein
VNEHPNPYQPPAARVSREDAGDVVVRPPGLAIAAIAVAAVTVISAGIAPSQLRTFRELFAGFGAGAELPWLSQVALDGVWIWSLLAVAAIGIATWIAATRLGTRATFRRMRRALAAQAALFVTVFLVTLLAFYLPIFRLGAVV